MTYHVLLIADSGGGDCRSLPGRWNDPDRAAAEGCQSAAEFFTATVVEVVVIETATLAVVLSTTAIC
jgi:hypothetical protein